MVFSIIGLLTGLAVLATGIYYRVKEKHDGESVRIYTIAAAAGAVVAIVSLLTLIF